MAHFRVPLVWQMYGHVNVEANSLQEAVDYALGPECPLPDGAYVDDSVLVDDTLLELNDSEDIQQTVAPKPPSRGFCVETPVGTLLVTPKTTVDIPDDFPGVYIDFIRSDGEKILLVCTEYESLTKMLQTCVYGDALTDEPTEVVEYRNLDFAE